MIAVMVLGIGLVGVGALVSVGALQAMRASVDDRKALLGQSGVKDRMVRGVCHAENWLTATGTSYMTAATASAPQMFPADTVGNANNLQPVAIDPLMVAGAAAASPSFTPQITNFASNGSTLSMPRLTLSSLAGAASQQACISEDDMFFTQSTLNGDVLPTNGYNSVGTKREFTAQYSWLATLVPVYGDLQSTETRNLMTMSIVVFNQRQFSISPSVTVSATNPPSERYCQVTGVSGSGYGGGDLTLSASTQVGLNLRVGECLMLGWMQADVPSSGGKATTFSGAATYSSTATRPMFRLYRILNAGPATGSGSSWTRNITVGGTDLNLSGSFIKSQSMYAFIYDGAVAVYERTVRLEGPSMWTY
jgi:hypothetical protein